MTRIRTNGIDIEVESFGRDQDPVILLIMGLGMQMLGWPEPLCRDLASRGFRVIRFDNRDSGLSTRLDALDAPSMLMSALRWTLHMQVPATYTLHDMASDAVGVLDGLGVRKAHVVGASMGGMIAQHLACDWPERVRSLVSMMSTSGARRVSRPSMKATRALSSRPPKGADSELMIEYWFKIMQTIGSPGLQQDPELVRQRIAENVKRGMAPMGTMRQLLAVMADGDRSDKLRRIRVPTLVIHGSEDPMVPVAAAHDTASKIAGARTEIIPGMGHDLPDSLWPRLVDLIATHCANADHTTA